MKNIDLKFTLWIIVLILGFLLCAFLSEAIGGYAALVFALIMGITIFCMENNKIKTKIKSLISKIKKDA